MFANLLKIFHLFYQIILYLIHGLHHPVFGGNKNIGRINGQPVAMLFNGFSVNRVKRVISSSISSPQKAHPVSKIAVSQKNIHRISCNPEIAPFEFSFIS